jgi:ribosome-associated heat shock protein Hsp15
MSEEVMRVDKWLWAARFYKTRANAAKECTAGRVKRAGKALKPAASIRVGDRLEVPSHDRVCIHQIEIKELLPRRVGAALAREAYVDHTPAEVLEQASAEREQRRKEMVFRLPSQQGRPTKRNRRLWERASGS